MLGAIVYDPVRLHFALARVCALSGIDLCRVVLSNETLFQSQHSRIAMCARVELSCLNSSS